MHPQCKELRSLLDQGSVNDRMPEKCSLAPLHTEDLPGLVALFTCPVGREFLGGALAEELAMQQAGDWIQRSGSEPIWAIRRSSDQSFVGYVLLDDHHDGDDVEISFAVLHKHWGRGFATEALVEAFRLASASLEIDELVAETQTKNLRCTQVLERVGMVEERRVKRFGEEQVIYRGRTKGISEFFEQ